LTGGDEVSGGTISLEEAKTKRILTGFRPTGKLHIGHLFGNIRNLVELQDHTEVFVFVADWHMLSTDYDRGEQLQENTRELVIDLVAAGLDPTKAVIYRQSDLPEVAELELYFSMITPISWLERNPTYKEQLSALQEREISTHGFLGYPVLQIADITIVKGEVVPVGEDQLPHLELGREIVRRFHHLFGGPCFPEPLGLLSEGARVPGSDGRKMSKSYDNAIFLADEPDTVRRKVRSYITDPQKIRMGDPGRPEICAVFALHELFTPQDDVAVVAEECRAGTRGCVACKDQLAENLLGYLAPISERRAAFGGYETAEKTLEMGFERVKPIAAETLRQVRELVGVGRSRSAPNTAGGPDSGGSPPGPQDGSDGALGGQQ
jgi:tryptophanyl-tRNA synthetase